MIFDERVLIQEEVVDFLFGQLCLDPKGIEADQRVGEVLMFGIELEGLLLIVPSVRGGLGTTNMYANVVLVLVFLLLRESFVFHKHSSLLD